MAHGEHDHEHAEEFPRAETVELVGRALDSDARRKKWQAALVALAVVLFALALPTERLFGRTVELVEATAHGRWSGPHLASSALAATLHALGMRAEPAWFLVSALGAGAAAFVMVIGAARRAVSTRASLLALAAIVLAPAFALAATTPSSAGTGLFGACLVFATLLAQRERPKPRLAASMWFAASLLHAWNVLLLPAVILAGGRRAVVPAFAALAGWLALVIAAGAREHDTAMKTLEHLGRTLLAGASGGPGPFLAWLAAIALGLAAGTFGLGVLLFSLGPIEMERPPKWVFAFTLVPLFVLGLGGVATWDVPGLWFVPVAYLGLAGIVESRLASPVALLVIAGLIVLGIARVGFLDDAREFRSAIERSGKEGLVVLTHDPERVYLLEQRYDLEAIDVSPALALDEPSRAAFFAEVEARIGTLQAHGHAVLFDPDAIRGESDSSQGSSRPSPDPKALAALVERAGIQALR
jgi:hypothetical protein